MPINLILAVGRNPELLERRCSILRAAGYIVNSERSVKQGLERFRNGDFDLVLLCHSIPAKEREQATCSIRNLGSLTPVVTVAPPISKWSDEVTEAVLEDSRDKLLSGIDAALFNAAEFYRPQNREWAFYY